LCPGLSSLSHVGLKGRRGCRPWPLPRRDTFALVVVVRKVPVKHRDGVPIELGELGEGEAEEVAVLFGEGARVVA